MPRATRNSASQIKSDDELVELLANPPKARCSVGQMIEEHPNGNEIATAIANPKWSAMQLAPVLSRKVRVVSSSMITAHRNRTCRCE